MYAILGTVRILIAPDKFAGTLTSSQAAEAIARGWREARPDDVLDLAPMSDGGPGFVAVLHAALGGALLPVTVRGPLGGSVEAHLLLHDQTVYVESAQACGVALTGGRDGDQATTVGVGDLLLAAREAGARQVVVGLGGSGTNDGGAGLLAALGASADRPLARGGAALAGITRLDLPGWDVPLVAATDVANPLTGPDGATRTFGPQKGVVDLDGLDAALADLGAALALPEQPGSGAAGGLGHALFALGATRRAGFDVVAEAVGLRERAARADLVLTGEGSYDDTGAAGKVPDGIRRLGRPTLVLAGRVQHPAGSSYSLVELVGEARALHEPEESLSTLGRQVAADLREAPE